MLNASDYNSLKQQFSELSVQINKKILYSYTGNLAIDSIVNYKLNTLAKYVQIQTEIAVPENLKFEIADITSILGNLLDNAIEAINDYMGKAYIFVKIVYSQGRLIIRISNSSKNKIVYENELIVTSKLDTKNHGIGLNSIKQIVEKHQGRIAINHNKEIVIVDILIYL